MPFVEMDIDVAKIFIATPMTLGLFRIVREIELGVQLLFGEGADEIGKLLILAVCGDDEIVLGVSARHVILSIVVSK